VEAGIALAQTLSANAPLLFQDGLSSSEAHHFLHPATPSSGTTGQTSLLDAIVQGQSLRVSVGDIPEYTAAPARSLKYIKTDLGRVLPRRTAIIFLPILTGPYPDNNRGARDIVLRRQFHRPLSQSHSCVIYYHHMRRRKGVGIACDA